VDGTHKLYQSTASMYTYTASLVSVDSPSGSTSGVALFACRKGLHNRINLAVTVIYCVVRGGYRHWTRNSTQQEGCEERLKGYTSLCNLALSLGVKCTEQ
jgi:hypothetical protein